MTFAMSTEGDSVKSALSEANDKNATDNHTDTSQDSIDIKESNSEKSAENNVNAQKEEEKPKDESTEEETEKEDSEKKDEVDKDKVQENPEENDKKTEKESDGVKEEKKDSKEGETKEEADKKKEEVEANNGKEEPKDEKASTASEKDEEEEGEEGEGEEDEEELEEEEEDNKKRKRGKKNEAPAKKEKKAASKVEESQNDSGKVEIEEGSGTPLGEIARVEASIMRFKNDDLKFLHKLLFNTIGKATQFKKNIKLFSGFPFKKNSDEYKKKVETCKKLEIKTLKSVCEMLDLVKTGSKDDLVDRIMEFLMEPKDSGKPVGGGRPKRASAVRANNRGYSSHDDYSSDERHAARSRRDKGKRPNLKEESSSDEEFNPGDASDASDEKPRAMNKRRRGRGKKGSSEEDEASLTDASSDYSDELPSKSKRRRSITKANSKLKPKTPGKRGRPAKNATAATPRKSTRGRKPKQMSSEEEDEEDERVDDGSSSEDEPLVKKKAKTNEPPTDDDIKGFIKSILEGANLEEITMKTVCQRVYDNYPDFDLTNRKNFIKSTVKSLIST